MHNPEDQTLNRKLFWKVCGMTDGGNIRDVAMLEPDFMGFIFYQHSKRYIGNTFPQVPQGIRKIGVFVNDEHSRIIQAVRDNHLYGIQLHGNEDQSYLKMLLNGLQQENLNPMIIKAISVDDGFDPAQLIPYLELTDFFLFDTKGKLPGGNGYCFNWKVLEQYPYETPYFLSGGLGPDQLTALLEFMETDASAYCRGIDLNSRFESAPGLKDPNALKQFKKQLQAYQLL